MKETIIVIWFKKDLRTQDHKPLIKAANLEWKVLALYVREPSVMSHKDYSNFHQYWIQESIKDLKPKLTQLGIPLLMFYCDMIQALDIIRKQYSISHIFAHEETWNKLTFERDKQVIKYCKNNSIIFDETPTNWVVRRLKNRDLRDKERNNRMSEEIIWTPNFQQTFVLDERLSWQAKETMQKFVAATKPEKWTNQREIPWETAWDKRLNHFLRYSARYLYAVSRPEIAFSDSWRLSWYITYWNLSIRQVYQKIKHHTNIIRQELKNENDKVEQQKKVQHIKSLLAIMSRIHWHCHFIQKLESWPEIEFINQNSAFNKIRTSHDPELIQCWADGQTGIPMVDAWMRCLKQTWRINFRMRAMITSFICNTCMQPWQEVAHILARYFLDYEPWIHYSQLQMQSWTTWINIIRIYNPIKQMEDKDWEYQFIKRWIPERPNDYPAPIVDVIQSNRESRIALWGVKNMTKTKIEWQKVYQKVWSRKKTFSKKKQPEQIWSLFDL